MINKGDFVKIEYSAKLEDGTIFDTTSEEDAKKAKIYNPRSKYGPVLFAAGNSEVIQGLDEAVLQSSEGEQKTIAMPPAKAFGERNADAVRLIPIAQFAEQKIAPQPGMTLELDGRRAKVQSVSGGRVRVDFNHELAGRTVTYSYKIIKVYTGAADKASALAEELLETKATLTGDTLLVEKTLAQAQVPDYVFKKMRFIEYLLQKLPEVKTIKFSEAYGR